VSFDKIAICNMALANIGAPPIQSLTEPGVGARSCKQRYDEARLMTLNAALWNFASVYRAAGAALDLTPKKPWSYVHSYPADAVRVFEIETAAVTDPPIPFEITDRDDGLSGKLIHSHVEEPTFIFTRDKQDTTTFDMDFVVAMAWGLASLIAMPVTKSVKVQQNAEKQFAIKTDRAVARTLNEGQADADQYALYHQARF
jgi:hypothetical protein